MHEVVIDIVRCVFVLGAMVGVAYVVLWVASQSK